MGGELAMDLFSTTIPSKDLLLFLKVLDAFVPLMTKDAASFLNLGPSSTWIDFAVSIVVMDFPPLIFISVDLLSLSTSISVGDLRVIEIGLVAVVSNLRLRFSLALARISFERAMVSPLYSKVNVFNVDASLMPLLVNVMVFGDPNVFFKSISRTDAFAWSSRAVAVPSYVCTSALPSAQIILSLLYTHFCAAVLLSPLDAATSHKALLASSGYRFAYPKIRPVSCAIVS